MKCNEWEPVQITSQRKIIYDKTEEICLWTMFRKSIIEKTNLSFLTGFPKTDLLHYIKQSMCRCSCETPSPDILHSLQGLIKHTIQRAALLLYQAWYWQMLTLPARLLLCVLVMGRRFSQRNQTLRLNFLFLNIFRTLCCFFSSSLYFCFVLVIIMGHTSYPCSGHCTFLLGLEKNVCFFCLFVFQQITVQTVTNTTSIVTWWQRSIFFYL